MIKFLIGKDAYEPKRNFGDAGYDFFVPKDFGGRGLEPGEDLLINTHIRVNMPENRALIAFNKSGVATKKHLQVGACVVDSSYMGEIHIHVFNWSKKAQTIMAGDKLVQFVPIKIEAEVANSYDGTRCTVEQFYYGRTSQRGEGGFGSTGDKA